ncbi:MAG: hypothetical protein IT429_17045 [Gemmataceae bacterium]|nr:hypothetical protein [Gemmataceae bacterium]
MWNLFAALRRLAAALNAMADLIDAANGRLASMLAVEDKPPLDVTPPESTAEAEPATAGRRRK